MNKLLKILFIVFILFCVFLAFKNIIKTEKTDYKNEKSGNTKSINEIEQYILNVSSYKAKIEVTVKSNKKH